jgi:hypothetical protein
VVQHRSARTAQRTQTTRFAAEHSILPGTLLGGDPFFFNGSRVSRETNSPNGTAHTTAKTNDAHHPRFTKFHNLTAFQRVEPHPHRDAFGTVLNWRVGFNANHQVDAVCEKGR